MQRLTHMLLAVLAALSIISAGCSSPRNPALPDGGTGYGTRPGGGSNPSPGTGSGGGGGGNTDTPAAPTTRHFLSWDGNVLRLRIIGPAFTAWKDGGGEVTINLDQGWSGQYIPFNASDARKNGITMARSGNELSLRKDGALPWLGQFSVIQGDKFNVKYIGPDGNIGWHKYETTDLSGVSLESDAGSSTSKSFRIPTQGII